MRGGVNLVAGGEGEMDPPGRLGGRHSLLDVAVEDTGLAVCFG